MKELNTNPSPTPPDTLSKLIRLAIKDARRLNKDTYWPNYTCLLYTSPSPRDRTRSRMPSSA